MDDREEWREMGSGISVLIAWHDDDDNDTRKLNFYYIDWNRQQEALTSRWTKIKQSVKLLDQISMSVTFLKVESGPVVSLDTKQHDAIVVNERGK